MSKVFWLNYASPPPASSSCHLFVFVCRTMQASGSQLELRSFNHVTPLPPQPYDTPPPWLAVDLSCRKFPISPFACPPAAAAAPVSLLFDSAPSPVGLYVCNSIWGSGEVGAKHETFQTWVFWLNENVFPPISVGTASVKMNMISMIALCYICGSGLVLGNSILSDHFNHVFGLEGGLNSTGHQYTSHEGNYSANNNNYTWRTCCFDRKLILSRSFKGDIQWKFHFCSASIRSHA